MDYYKNTIDDMQNEKDFLNYYNVFEYFHDFEKVFLKIVDALLVYEVWDNNVCLYEIDYYKFLLSVCLFD